MGLCRHHVPEDRTALCRRNNLRVIVWAVWLPMQQDSDKPNLNTIFMYSIIKDPILSEV
jgi:hypothetical protein